MLAAMGGGGGESTMNTSILSELQISTSGAEYKHTGLEKRVNLKNTVTIPPGGSSHTESDRPPSSPKKTNKLIQP